MTEARATRSGDLNSPCGETRRLHDEAVVSHDQAGAFAAAERVADAVLYEGYVLYPYRASAVKNRFRWQFGIVAPRSPRGDEGEPSFSQTECLLDLRNVRPQPDQIVARLFIRVRFLRPRQRHGDADTSDSAAWLEGVPHAIDLNPFDLVNLPLIRECPLGDSSLDARAVVEAWPVDDYVKVRVRLENCEPWRPEFDAYRDGMLARSLVGTHLLLAVEHGRFLSLLEPPAEAEAIVGGCQNRHTWPVLVGDPSQCRLMLSSPIVLYDFPAIAKESQGDLCDAAEIDEILSLRIMTMTDEEKREARATDPRARTILDRVDALTPDALSAMHGTMRSVDFFNPPGARARRGVRDDRHTPGRTRRAGPAAAEPSRRRDGHVPSRSAGDGRRRLPRRRRPCLRGNHRRCRSRCLAARLVRPVLLFRSCRSRTARRPAPGASMKKILTIAASAAVAYAVVSSWPELVRYMRIRSM